MIDDGAIAAGATIKNLGKFTGLAVRLLKGTWNSLHSRMFMEPRTVMQAWRSKPFGGDQSS